MLQNYNCSDGKRPLSLATYINESVLLVVATAGAKASASLPSWLSRFEVREPDQLVWLWELKGGLEFIHMSVFDVQERLRTEEEVVQTNY